MESLTAGKVAIGFGVYILLVSKEINNVDNWETAAESYMKVLAIWRPDLAAKYSERDFQHDNLVPTLRNIRANW